MSENNKKILTGNEALVEGLIGAKVQFLSNYPGTPTSEIGNGWAKYASKNSDVQYDLSINEKVAFEAAVGASWSGVRSAVGFKHLGMNVVSDSLHSVMYSGIDGARKAGLVILCGGDPDIQSSTNAEDIRLFSFHSKLPILEPATIQECLDFVPLAFELSELWNLPVMIYTPTILNHSSALISLENMGSELEYKNSSQIFFQKNGDRYLNAIHWARNNQQRLHTQISRITSLQKMKNHGERILSQVFSTSPLDGIQEVTINSQKYKLAIIACGIGRAYVDEIPFLKSLPLLEAKLTYPLISEPILEFIREVSPDYLLVIEEQEPFLESQITALLYENQIYVKLIGKNTLPSVGSLNTDIIIQSLAKFGVGELKNIENKTNVLADLPIREPTFCSGCSHRNVFYSLRKATDEYEEKTGISPVFGGDIGCYTMSMSAPYNTIDYLVCMGAGAGIANGITQMLGNKNAAGQKQHVIAMMGDSTFFHSGIAPIQNLIKNNANVLIIILDNYYTAMTGHQPSPSTPNELRTEQFPVQQKLSIESIVTSFGDYPTKILSGYNIDLMKKKFLKLFSEKAMGPKFVIVKAECALYKGRRLKIKNKEGDLPYSYTSLTISDACVKCNECFETLGCTAIYLAEDQYEIDNSKCIGETCLACIQVCPNTAIYKATINPHLPTLEEFYKRTTK